MTTELLIKSLEDMIELVTAYKMVIDDIKVRWPKRTVLINYLEVRLREKLAEIVEECKN